MATTVYKSGTVYTIDGKELYLTPLKIKYYRQFMDAFNLVKDSKNDDDAISLIVDCVAITMKQYYPEFSTPEEVEDNFDLSTIYKILEIAGEITISQDKNESVTKQANDSESSWDNLDLAKMEAEAFLLGIWKDYEDLETSLSMPELIATLNSKRDADYNEKKFLAAIQGVDLDKQTGKADENAWEKLKAKVFSGGKTADPNDITSLQGYNAQKAGFGIGMGLSYEDLTQKN